MIRHYKNSFELTELGEGHAEAQGIEAIFSRQTSSLNLKLLYLKFVAEEMTLENILLRVSSDFPR
jgi:hypothetical protein